MDLSLLASLKRRVFGLRKQTVIVLSGISLCSVLLISCGTLSSTIVAPPSIPGAEFVGSDQCRHCHKNIAQDFKTASHARLKTKGHNAENIGCESCHGPGSKHVEAGGGAGSIVNPNRSPETCFQCHLNIRSKFKLPFTHPLGAGKVSCSDCHDPHKGGVIKGGGTEFMGKNDVCLKCHSAQRGPFVHEHEAVRDGCVTCHDPHGSVNPRMLTERNQSLCLKCHVQRQTVQGRLFIGEEDHTFKLTQGTCWSAGCHEAVHGSQVSNVLRF
jgi:predicted CXXCH cytochrome family protein